MDSELVSAFSSVQSPVNWGLRSLRENTKINRLVERLKESLEEPNDNIWKLLNVLLVLSFEQYENACEITHLKDAEEIIVAYMVKQYAIAVQHVVYGLWAQFFLKNNDQVRAKKYISQIRPFSEMSKSDKAAVLAIKAGCFMVYGPEGYDIASNTLTEVLKLERNEPEWYHLKGKVLARQRRLHYRSPPTKTEISFLRKAVELEEKCARYKVHLARSLADLSVLLYHSQTCWNDFRVLRGISTEAISLLLKAKESCAVSPRLLSHIARSFMKLPADFREKHSRDLNFCVKHAIEMAPGDPMVNHTVGLYHLVNGRKADAIFFLREAANMGVYGANIDLCRLQWEECRAYDPVPDLTKLIQECESFWKSEVHMYLATYYLFSQNDLSATIRHWRQWHHSSDKQSYACNSFFASQECFDLTSVLYDEVRLALKFKRYDSQENKLLLEETVNSINKNRPELQAASPKWRRQDIIDKSQMLSRVGRERPKTPHYKKRNGFKGKGLVGKGVTKQGRDNSAKRGKGKPARGKDFKPSFDLQRQNNRGTGGMKRSQSHSDVFSRRSQSRSPSRSFRTQSLDRHKLNAKLSGRLTLKHDLLAPATASFRKLVRSYKSNSDDGLSSFGDEKRRSDSRESLSGSQRSADGFDCRADGHQREFNRRFSNDRPTWRVGSGDGRSSRECNTFGERKPFALNSMSPRSETYSQSYGRPSKHGEQFEHSKSKIRDGNGPSFASTSTTSASSNWRNAGGEPSLSSSYFQSFKENEKNLEINKSLFSASPYEESQLTRRSDADRSYRGSNRRSGSRESVTSTTSQSSDNYYEFKTDLQRVPRTQSPQLEPSARRIAPNLWRERNDNVRTHSDDDIRGGLRHMTLGDSSGRGNFLSSVREQGYGQSEPFFGSRRGKWNTEGGDQRAGRYGGGRGGFGAATNHPESGSGSHDRESSRNTAWGRGRGNRLVGGNFRRGME